MQMIDMGIALCHFDLAAKETGVNITFELNNPKLESNGDVEYVASYRLVKQRKNKNLTEEITLITLRNFTDDDALKYLRVIENKELQEKQ